MKECDAYFKEIQKQFPKTMSKEQFYQVAHISKETARVLLQCGLVPCQDSEKKTRRYTIKTDDVIAYLKDRTIHPNRYRLREKDRRRSSNRNAKRSRTGPYEFSPEQEKLLADYYLSEMESYDDLISVRQLAEFSGYNMTSVVNWCNSGALRHLQVGRKYLIPKIYAAEYLASTRMCDLRQMTYNHKRMLSDFVKKNKTRI